MRLHRRLLYLALLFALPARADLIKLAVYDFRAQGAAVPLATVLQGKTADALQRQGFFKVVTSDALRSLLALERQKQLLGCSEGESTCMAEVADALGVQYLATGSVTALGKKGAETFSFEISLLDVAKSRRESSELVTGASEAEVVSQVPSIIGRLTAKLAAANSGQLKLSATERGAVVKIDDGARGTTSDATTLPIPAGVHTVTIEKDGFITWQRELKVQPKQDLELRVELEPSPDYARAQTRKATAMRTVAITTSVLTAAAAGVFIYAKLQVQALDGSATVVGDTFEYHKAQLVAGIEKEDGVDHRLRAESLRSQIDSMLTVSWIALGAGIACGVTALVLWVVGDSPSKYGKFLEAVKVSVAPTPGGGVGGGLTLSF